MDATSKFTALPFEGSASAETSRRACDTDSDLTRESCAANDIFVTTQWTVVRAAGNRSTPGAERALADICRTYWFPLYAYVRRRSRSKEDAEDMTQEFFRQLLERHWLEDVDRNKGRLRAFLVTALKRFMANEWRRATAHKRGGGQTHISIDSGLAEGRYAAAGSPRMDAETMFDRQWALTLLELTVKHLEEEYAAAGKTAEFTAMKGCLVIFHQAIDYSTIAGQLEVNEGAARVGVHRLRKRFRQLYRDKVAQTLPPGSNLDEEMRYLAKSLMQE